MRLWSPALIGGRNQARLARAASREIACWSVTGFGRPRLAVLAVWAVTVTVTRGGRLLTAANKAVCDRAM
jgi:hypothetical protein